jgi:hypothetical protein
MTCRAADVGAFIPPDLTSQEAALYDEVRRLRHRLGQAEADNEQLCAVLSLFLGEPFAPLPYYGLPPPARSGALN